MIDSMSEIPVDPDGNPRPQCEDSPTPGIEILGATEFDHLFARDEIIETFTLGFGECSGLLGATMEVTALEDAGEIETINPKRRTSKQWAAAVVAADKEPHSGIHVLQLLAYQVTMQGCWTSGLGLNPVWTAWSAGPWFSFPLIFPNPMSEIETNIQMLLLVLFLLTLQFISLLDTRTMRTRSTMTWQTHSHRTDQLTTQSISNQTWIYHTAESTTFWKSCWIPSRPTWKQM